MASAQQNRNGKWEITGLYTTVDENPDNITVPVKLFYNGTNGVNFRVSNDRTRSALTPWETPLGEAIDKNLITLQSEFVTGDDGTVYSIDPQIIWENGSIQPYR